MEATVNINELYREVCESIQLLLQERQILKEEIESLKAQSNTEVENELRTEVEDLKVELALLKESFDDLEVEKNGFAQKFQTILSIVKEGEHHSFTQPTKPSHAAIKPEPTVVKESPKKIEPEVIPPTPVVAHVEPPKAPVAMQVVEPSPVKIETKVPEADTVLHHETKTEPLLDTHQEVAESEEDPFADDDPFQDDDEFFKSLTAKDSE
jgi:type IV secretory pathway VirB10-like protein